MNSDQEWATAMGGEYPLERLIRQEQQLVQGDVETQVDPRCTLHPPCPSTMAASVHCRATDSAVTTTVYFRVGIQTQFGESVGVVGNVPELGNWDPVNAHFLKTENQCFPCWYSEAPISLPVKMPVRYKYVIVGGDRTLLRWVDGASDRVLVPTGEHMVVEDDNGEFRKAVQLPPKASICAPQADGDQKMSGASMVAQDAKQASKLKVTEELHSLSDSSLAKVDSQDTVYIVSLELPVKVERVKRGYSESMDGGGAAPNSCNAADGCDAGSSISGSAIPGNSENASSDEEDSYEYTVVKQKYLFLPTLHSLRNKVSIPVKFVGWPGLIVKTQAEQRKIRRLLEPYGCIPVFPDPEPFFKYIKFLQRFLWPTFHNVLILNTEEQAPFDTDEWSSYQVINRVWSDTVVSNAHETDLIFVNDLSLLLVPQYVIRKIRRANVGLFLHTPFPSSEIFRCLPVREEILRGMLCADLLGFQFFEYARHFLVACKRLIGLEHSFRLGGFLGIDYCGRSVSVKISHVHIQYDDLRSLLETSNEINTQSAAIRDIFKGKFLFASVDRSDRLAGLLLKFRAFQLFLRNYPYARDRCVLVQYAYPTLSDESEKMLAELTGLAAEINREFRAHCPKTSTGAGSDDTLNPMKAAKQNGDIIILISKIVTTEEKYALFSAADCLLDTSIRDGLNLNPFEYICCRRGTAAAIILSEFTGSSHALALAQRVNPWKPDGVASAMDSVVHGQDPAESRDRQTRDEQYMQIHSTLGWAEDVLRDTRRARKRDDLLYVSWGFANTFRVLGLDSHFRPLDVRKVSASFRQSKCRVLFFDHEGTLAADRRRITAVPGTAGTLSATGTAPSAQVKDCLRSLLADSSNVVVILSGRGKSLLDEWFGDIEGVGLCAEHGYYVKVPMMTGDEWQCPLQKPDFTWKMVATQLMQQYVHRTPGAFVENKGSALVFQYRDADPDFGAWQAKELSSYLHELMFGYPVTTMEGKGYVEVKLRGVNKGRAVETVLGKLKKHPMFGDDLDFVFCIGDDRTDEDMFAAVEATFGLSAPDTTEQTVTTHIRRRNFGENSPARKATPAKVPYVYTVTVGRKPSKAKFYVNDVDDVSEILRSLALTMNQKSIQLGHSESDCMSLTANPKTSLLEVSDADSNSRKGGTAPQQQEHERGQLSVADFVKCFYNE